VVTIDSAILGQAVGFREEDLGRDIADDGCDGSDSNLSEILQHGIACQDENGPFLVGR
jgi:hypothetical protein